MGFFSKFSQLYVLSTPGSPTVQWDFIPNPGNCMSWPSPIPQLQDGILFQIQLIVHTDHPQFPSYGMGFYSKFSQFYVLTIPVFPAMEYDFLSNSGNFMVNTW